MPIDLRCVKCLHAYSVPDKFAGKQFRCKSPECDAVLTVPDQGSAPLILDEVVHVSRAVHHGSLAGSEKSIGSPSSESVTCGHCGGLLLNDAEIAGQVVECTHCGSRLHMPHLQAATPTPPPAAPRPDERTSHNRPPLGSTRSGTVSCCHCGGPLVNDAEVAGKIVECTYCGGRQQMPLLAGSMIFVAPAPMPPPAKEKRRRRRKEPIDHEPRPGKVQAIAILTLVGGIFAILYGLGFGATTASLTCGLGCLWPGMYYSIVIGILATIKGSQLLGSGATQHVPPRVIAILMAINIINGDIVNLVLGLLILVFCSDPAAQAFFLHTGGSHDELPSNTDAPPSHATPGYGEPGRQTATAWSYETGFIAALQFPFRDANWTSKLGLLALIQYLPVFGYFAVRGWRIELARRVTRRAPEPLPAWDNLGPKLLEGFLLFGIWHLYQWPAVIVGSFTAVLAVLDLLRSELIGALFEGDDRWKAHLAALLFQMLAKMIIEAFVFVWGILVQVFFWSALMRYIHCKKFAVFVQFLANGKLVKAHPDKFFLYLLYGTARAVLLTVFLTVLVATAIGSIFIPAFTVPVKHWITGYYWGDIASQMTETIAALDQPSG